MTRSLQEEIRQEAVRFWIQIEALVGCRAGNIDRLTGQAMQRITGQALVLKTSPLTGVVELPLLSSTVRIVAANCIPTCHRQ
jgi:hypothetical protein